MLTVARCGQVQVFRGEGVKCLRLQGGTGTGI